jgi:two-component system, OmpR family, sensor kinase
MGRLFWKFLLFIWLAQLVGIVGVGAYFWYERNQAPQFAEGPPFDRPPDDERRPPPPPRFGDAPQLERPADGEMRQAPPRNHRRDRGLPAAPLLSGLMVSLLSALALAWYFARPIRQLRHAFEAAAGGDLGVRIGDGMGGRRDELADLGRDFDHMTERLGLLVDGQKRLLHDVSHEMRSPLARLQAAIGLARQQPEHFDETLTRIEREGERLDALVDELLTLSRLQAGVAGEREDVDMQELLEGIVEDARFEGAARQVNVELSATGLPTVRANPALLHRAIENVVRNALHHSPPGGVVQVTGHAEGNRLRLSITDQGPGVPAEALEKIFQPFYRGGGKTSGGGYGLGLAIAERVIAAVDGQIRAKIADAGGLVVDIDLPV